MAIALRRRLTPPRDIFPIHEWKIEAVKYLGRYVGEAETVFCLANGYLGMRGTDEEGRPASEDATFINGFYETRPIVYGEEAYGYPETGQTMVPVTDCKLIRLIVDGEVFDLPSADIIDFRRTLDMEAATLEREVLWARPSGKRIHVRSKRFVSFHNRHLAGIVYEVNSLDDEADIVISSEIVNQQPSLSSKGDPRRSQGFAGDVFVPVAHEQHDRRIMLCHRTAESGMTVACGIDHRIDTHSPYSYEATADENQGRVVFSIDAEPDRPIKLVKFMAYYHTETIPLDELRTRVTWSLDRSMRRGFDDMLERHRKYVDKFWRSSNIEIGGQPALQQTIRWNLFQLMQASGRVEGAGIGARGLTGGAYEGHYFWDTEMYVLPFLIYTAPSIAKSLLMFRYNQLDKARKRAHELGHRGALFPWRTINGNEASAYWAASTAQYHINADIMFALQKYVNATGDEDFIEHYGAEMLVETARLWVDLGCYIDNGGRKFCINGVTGPDEYTAIVNNNLFTNLMARENLRYAIATVENLRDEKPEWLDYLVGRTGLKLEEIDEWREAAEHMFLPYDERAGIYEQDDSFHNKEVWDFENTPEDKYPLLLHYHPLTLYRHQVIKQADNILALFLLGREFTLEEKRANFDYYDPLTTGDSSLSVCIQSIFASEIGYDEKALEYFNYAAVMDLGDVAGNVKDGAHIASIGGCWMALVYGFAGMRDYDGVIRFRPRLPGEWECLRLPLTVRGQDLEVDIRPDGTTYTLRQGDGLAIFHEDQEVRLVQGKPVFVKSSN